ncbi:double-stranded DNA-binding domain-containing protein [Pelagophyceae sp. CCMP2097]|nr:double-stranded DNA-binding domain-containing protein [Pelagophyceae sp. CCMP2097]
MEATGEVPDGYTADPQQMQQQQEQQQQKASILKQILTPEAGARLGRVQMVKPEKAEMLSMRLIQMAMKGELQSQVTEEQLIELLESTAEGSQVKVKVARRSKCEDDDDNDDDLF